MQETPLEVRIFRKEMHRNGLITRIRSCQISPFEVEDAFLAKQLWVVVVCRRNSLTLGTNSAVGDSEQLRVLNLQNIPKLYISMGWFYWIGTVLDGKHQVLYLQYVFWDNLQARRELTGHLWYAQGRMGDVVCPQTSKTPKNPRWIGFGDCYCGWFRMISMVSTCHLIYFYYIYLSYMYRHNHQCTTTLWNVWSYCKSWCDFVRLANPVGQISVSAFRNATLFGLT